MENRIPIMLSIQEASDASGLSYECIRQLCISGQIVHIRSGRKYLINQDKFISFLNGETHRSGTEQPFEVLEG